KALGAGASLYRNSPSIHMLSALETWTQSNSRVLSRSYMRSICPRVDSGKSISLTSPSGVMRMEPGAFSVMVSPGCGWFHPVREARWIHDLSDPREIGRAHV